MGSRRSDSLPHPRASALFARTIYKELRRAGYNKADFVRFLCDMMAIMSEDAKAIDPDVDRHLDTVIDAETGLPNLAVANDVIDFEIQRVLHAKQGGLLVLVVELTIPDWCPDALAARMHLVTAATMSQLLRSNDTVVRIERHRYLAILPHGTELLVPDLLSRLGRGLSLRRRQDDEPLLPAGIGYSVRWLRWSAEMTTARALVEKCLAQPEISLSPPLPPSGPAASMVETTPSTRSPTSGPAGRAEQSDGKRHVVLALGGGAGRSAAHIGVIRALRAANVVVDGIAGTSAGALVGAMHLLGMGEEAMIDRFEQFSYSDCYKQMRRLYAGYLRRAKRARRANNYFRQSGWSFLSDVDIAAIPDDVYARFIEYFAGPDVDIARLSIPFAATATDLVDGRSSVYRRGSLHAALRATCAVPGLFAPQRDNSRLLVDGAIVADVPVDAALSLGLEPQVLAIYLARIDRKVQSFSTSAEVLTRASAFVHAGLVREQLRSAPLLVTVPVGDINWLDFRHARRTADIGDRAMTEAIDDLVRDLDRGATVDSTPRSRREL